MIIEILFHLLLFVIPAMLLSLLAVAARNRCAIVEESKDVSTVGSTKESSQPVTSAPSVPSVEEDTSPSSKTTTEEEKWHKCDHKPIRLVDEKGRESVAKCNCIRSDRIYKEPKDTYGETVPLWQVMGYKF
jgi:hypothetical protein